MTDISKHFPLQNHQTFGIVCYAKYFAKASDNEQLTDVLLWAKSKNETALILGAGSNVLFTEDYRGLVVKILFAGIEVASENEDHAWIKVGAGVAWHDLVIYCVKCGFGGIENLSLIPGTVGAAPMQNIGAYGVEIKEVFESLEAIDRETMGQKIFDKNACRFGYRQSVFKNELKGQYVITSVTLRLNKKPIVNTSYGAIREELANKNIASPSIRDVSDVVIQIRKSKLPDPSAIGNAGSFFKNPVIDLHLFEKIKTAHPDIPGYSSAKKMKVPAGWLIEKCGWKGKRIGNIGVHEKQALVLVNYGGGKGEDLLKLAKLIQASVQGKFEIDLETEVNVF